MFITPFTTSRIKAEMRELTLQEAIDMCEVPPNSNELGISRALGMIVSESNLPLHEWTVQERYAAICHYITAQEQGDWRVTEDTMFSDFVISKDYPEEYYSFDDLMIVPLTGEYAEICERYVISKGEKAKEGDWVLAVMAATIRYPNEEWDGKAEEFVYSNIEKLLNLPEPDFAELVEHFELACKKLEHCFELAYLSQGIAAVSQKGGAEQSAVQFHFNRIIAPRTVQLWQAA